MRLFPLVLFYLMPLFYFHTKDENWLYYGLGIFLPLTLINLLYDFFQILKDYKKSVTKMFITFAAYTNLIVMIVFFFKGEYQMIMYVTGYFLINAICIIIISLMYARKGVQPKG